VILGNLSFNAINLTRFIFLLFGTGQTLLKCFDFPSQHFDSLFRLLIQNNTRFYLDEPEFEPWLAGMKVGVTRRAAVI
jgi:hypothetical protein